ncbi:MAG: class I SAM-dependent RNA methyltransferase [Galactobacter sp.]
MTEQVHADQEPRDAEVVEVELTDIAKDGPAVGRVDGRAVFARHGAPGERVRVRMDPHKPKARWLAGDVIEVLSASEHRVPHVWPQADVLLHGPDEVPGGAEFGHLELAYQLELKGRILEGQLSRLAGIDAADLGFTGVEPALEESADGLHWRTRSAFGVDAGGRLAMRARASHRMIPTPEFPLAVAAVDRLGLGDLDLSGLERVEVAVPTQGQALVLLVPETRTSAPRQARGRRGRGPRPVSAPTRTGLAAVERVAASLPDGVAVASLVQTGGAAADGAGSLTPLRGATDLIERVEGFDFRVTGEGFWQVHRSAPATLTRAVLDAVGAEQGQAVADLYGGAGLFSVPLAQAVTGSGKLVSVEGAPGTHRDAEYNLRRFPQATAVQGRVERVLETDAEKYNAVVLDPPRAGAGVRAVSAIAASGTDKVVYVACDPAALAKDAARLAEAGYRMSRIRGFDLYPHTHHLEAVAVFTKA